VSGPARIVEPPRPDATRVVLVRHGESVCGRTGIVGGHRGCSGLTGVGRAEAGALAARLAATGELSGAAALYSSVLPRAVETARLIAAGIGGGGLELRQDCDLCELHPGEADGRRFQEIVDALPDWDADPTTPLAPGGEGWTSFVERAAGAVAALARCHRGRLVVAVCHGGVVEATMLRLGRMGEPSERLGLPTRHTSLTEWEQWGDRWRLVRYNDAAHLATLRPEDGVSRRSEVDAPLA
jgi:probable phosphoglycerate mutase